MDTSPQSSQSDADAAPEAAASPRAMATRSAAWTDTPRPPGRATEEAFSLPLPSGDCVATGDAAARAKGAAMVATFSRLML